MRLRRTPKSANAYNENATENVFLKTNVLYISYLFIKYVYN